MAHGAEDPDALAHADLDAGAERHHRTCGSPRSLHDFPLSELQQELIRDAGQRIIRARRDMRHHAPIGGMQPEPEPAVTAPATGSLPPEARHVDHPEERVASTALIREAPPGSSESRRTGLPRPSPLRESPFRRRRFRDNALS